MAEIGVFMLAPNIGLLACNQGGIIGSSRRTNVTVSFPVSFGTIFSVLAQGYVNNQNSDGRGWNVVKTISNTNYVFYGGFDMTMQNFWIAFGT